MKSLFLNILIVALICSPVISNGQHVDKVIKVDNKFGVQTTGTKYFKIPAEFDEIHRVTKSLKTDGYICRKGKIWSYYEYGGKLKKDSLDIDNWVANSKYDHGWVEKDDVVYIFDLEKFNRSPISSDTVHYEPGKHIVVCKDDTLQGLISTKGEVIVPCQWAEFLNEIKLLMPDSRPFLFANKNHNGGAFYDDNGKLILKFDYQLTYLGPLCEKPFLRIDKKGLPMFEGRQALALLDVKNKKIKFITGFDFWYMNQAGPYTAGKPVAHAAYPNKTEVYIFEDGHTESAQK